MQRFNTIIHTVIEPIIELSYLGIPVTAYASFAPLNYQYVSQFQCNNVTYLPSFNRTTITITNNSINSTSYNYLFIPNAYNLLSFQLANAMRPLSNNLPIQVQFLNGTLAIISVLPNSNLLLSNFYSVSFNSTQLHPPIRFSDVCSNTFTTFNPYTTLKASFPLTINYATMTLMNSQSFTLRYH